MPRLLRPLLACAAIASACSLDLDESLISGTGGDASTDAPQSFGGFPMDGSQWVDAPTEDSGSDVSDAAFDSSTDSSDSGPVQDGVGCGAMNCSPGEFCCWDSGNGVCQSPTSCSAVNIGCDEAADCGAGEVCCLLDVMANVGCTTECPSLVVGMVQFCDGDTECMTGMCDVPTSLVQNLLPPGYKACQ